MKTHGSNTPIFNINDFAKTAPEFGYSRKLKKIVFKNKEAFWLCAVAAEQPHILDGVPFKYDNEFKRAVIEDMSLNDPSYKDIQKYLSKQLFEAMNIHDSLGDDMYKCFNVDPNDPNNVGKMEFYNSKGKGNIKKLGEDAIQ
jgi:hypothetical protein